MAENNNHSGPKGEPDILRSLLYRYIPYLPLAVLIVSICLLLAFLYSRIAVKSYEITATVLIQDQKKGMDESKMLEALDVFKGTKIVENEIEVLRSRALVKQVVKNLGLYAEVTEHQQFREVPVYGNAPFYVRVKDPDKMQLAESIAFRYDSTQRKITIADKAYPLNQWVNTPWGELSFITNNNYQVPAYDHTYTLSLTGVKPVEERLLKSLEVNTLNKLASLVTLKLKDSDKKRGEDILNELLTLYTRAEVESKNILAGDILASVENRLRFVVGQLDSVESAIQRFRSDEGVIDIGAQGRLYLENVGQYDRQLQDVSIRLAVLDEVDRYISSRNSAATVMPSALGVDDPSLSQMLGKLNDAQLEYEKLKTTTAENSPLLVGVKDQIERIRPAIKDMVDNQRRNLQITRDNLNRTSTRYSSMLSSIPLKEKKLVEISRQQSIKNEIYSYLLQRREEAALSYATAKPDSKVVDRAEASIKHVSPKMSIIYLAAMIIGALLTILYVAVREGFSKKVLFRKEIEDISPIPIVGELIHVKHPEPVIYQDKEKSFAVEQFRALRNTLTVGTGKEQNKVLFVTSAFKNEGKSFVSLNLALSLASIGKKSVLSDMDVYHHKVTRHVDMDGKAGLSDFVKYNAGVQNIIHASSLNPLLYVIPIGTAKQSGLELGATAAFDTLFEKLRSQFDQVVINSGAFTINANSQAVSNYADASLFIIRHGKTTKSGLVLLSNEGLNNLKNPCFVFNDVKKRGWVSGGYGFGYGYGYEIKPASL